MYCVKFNVKIRFRMRLFSNWATFGNVPATTLENQRPFVSFAHYNAANCGDLPRYIGELF